MGLKHLALRFLMLAYILFATLTIMNTVGGVLVEVITFIAVV